MKKLLFILTLTLNFNTYAANTCGDDLDNNCWDCGKTASDICTARLDTATQKLTITGDGYMKDYDYAGGPWGRDITSVEMSDIKSIGKLAFYYSSIKEVEIPSSVEVIGTAAFQAAKQLSSVTFEEGSKLKTIADGAFNADPNLKSFDIPDGVTLIGHNAFNMSSIDYLVLPDSVFSVDDVEADAEAGYFHGLSFFGLSDVSNVFCSEAMQTECEKYFNNEESMFWEKGTYYPLKSKSSLAIYTSDGDKFYANGKWYDSLNDMNKGQYNVKRIYTIDEANKVTGTKNRVSIKYR